jgi:methylated-DNA-protein-cysteine methyltransferase-like protein
VQQIPSGRVATYGQVAAMVGGCTARMVGYAMAALLADDVPWQRVINRQGKISPRGGGDGAWRQQQLLTAEGVEFNPAGQVDLSRFGWPGPDWEWLEQHHYYPAIPPWIT